MNAAVRDDIFLSCFRGLSLFSRLDDEQLRFLATDISIFSPAKGEIVCKKGDRLEGMYCVVRGKVKLAVLSPQGSERVVEIISPGNTFGDALMFLDRPCPLYAQTLAASQLVYIRKSRILEGVQRYPDLALSMLGGLSARLHRLVRDVEVCCLQSAGERLAGYLVEQARSSGGGASAAQITLPAGKAVVASTLNLTPETFSRELHHLAAAGLISVERSTIRIHDLAALESSLTQ